jgi:hypothetical protein
MNRAGTRSARARSASTIPSRTPNHQRFRRHSVPSQESRSCFQRSARRRYAWTSRLETSDG